MSLHGLNAIEKFGALSLDLLDRYGVTLTHGTDFHEYKRLAIKARDGHPVGMPFDVDHFDPKPENASWIMGRDQDGKIMHLQALRLLPLGGRSVAEYYRKNFRQYPPPGVDIDMMRSRYRPGPGAKVMAGRVVYSGETWVLDDPRFRKAGLIEILYRYTMMVALQRYNADYVVGFMAQQLAHKGFGLRIGFMHFEPFALKWFIRGRPDPVQGIMTHMSAEDIKFVLDLPSAELAALAA